MSYQALASDYDGTLAAHGVLAEPTRAALARWRAAGRKVILVTGREMGDLERVCPPLELFDRIVAENGAVVFNPATRSERLLVPPPPEKFVQEVQRQVSRPLYRGRVIVATTDEYEAAVRELIAAERLPLHVILNKGAVMVLPHGVDKATGLRAALEELHIAPDQTIGVGDAENDQALLALCGLPVAVANALPELKAQARWVTSAADGAGVAELIDRVLAGQA